MSQLTSAVGSLILLLLLYSLLESLLPAGSIARFVRLAMSLILLAAAASFLGDGSPAILPELAPALADWHSQAADYTAQGQEIAGRLTAEARSEQEQAAARQAAALAQVVDGVRVEQARVGLNEDGGVDFIRLELSADRPEAAQEVKDLICGFYLLEEQRVECVGAGGAYGG